MECVCPKPASLTTIPNSDCPENLGQIQKMIFQRPGYVFDVAAVPTPNPFLELASWTPLLTAVDDTKVVVTPYLQNTIIPPAEAITIGGGDNTTLNGREEVAGATNPVVTSEMKSVKSAIVEAMKELGCEDLVVFFINEFDQLVGRTLTPGATPQNQVVGIPIHALFVSDSQNDGKNTFDKAPFRFGVDYGWRKDLYIVKPNFSPKASLIVP